jgi:hypothetical protein
MSLQSQLGYPLQNTPPVGYIDGGVHGSQVPLTEIQKGGETGLQENDLSLGLLQLVHGVGDGTLTVPEQDRVKPLVTGVSHQ